MRILWVAVADARGHLMRAHLARKLLAPELEVEIATTSQAGIDFLRALGTPAKQLGRGYQLAFDARQNLDRAETERRLLRYLMVELVAIGHLERERALSVGRAIRGVNPFITEAILADFEALLSAAKRG